MPKLQLFAVLFFSAAGLAQNPTPTPQLSPKAAYDNAIHPLEITRNSMSNWSDTEIAAFELSVDRANAECAARNPASYTGANLIDIGKLCALGQNYPAVIEASSLYIAADAPKPQLAQAYARLIDAQLHIKDEPAAFHSAQAMLLAVPCDTLTAEAINEAINFMQFVYTPDALTLALTREPRLLALMAATAHATHSTLTTPAYPNAEPAQSLHDLYADGVGLAALQQLAKAPPASIAATLNALDAVLPSTLSPDDAIPIELTRRRYALLGQPLPDLDHPTHPADPRKPVHLTTLDIGRRLPQIPARNAITALLLFPDWCAACVRMDTKAPRTVFTVAGHEAYIYGLLAQTVPPNPPRTRPTTVAAIAAADAANYLRGTPTLIVDPSFLDQFAVDAVPVLIVTDAQGIVRVVQPVSDDAINPGGTIDSAIAYVGASWPPARHASRLPLSATKASSAP